MKIAVVALACVLAGPAWSAAPTTIYLGKAEPFIVEGIARDGGRFFVASVARQRIVAISNGRMRDFARLPNEYSPLGIAPYGGTLWVTAATLPQGAGHDGPSALIAIDKSRGQIRHVYPVADAGKTALNDLAFAPGGTVYASDSLSGAIYVLPPGAAVLTKLGTLLKSPQGMAVSADGKFLLVADYALGLVKLDLASGNFRPLQIPDGVNVKGIDGLARLSDGSFVASQNGLKQPRILRLHLSPDWSKVQTLEVVDESDPLTADPSLVTADASGVYVVGISQWSSFGQNSQTPTKPLQPWRIVRFTLP